MHLGARGSSQPPTPSPGEPGGPARAPEQTQQAACSLPAATASALHSRAHLSAHGSEGIGVTVVVGAIFRSKAIHSIHGDFWATELVWMVQARSPADGAPCDQSFTVLSDPADAISRPSREKEHDQTMPVCEAMHCSCSPVATLCKRSFRPRLLKRIAAPSGLKQHEKTFAAIERTNSPVAAFHSCKVPLPVTTSRPSLLNAQEYTLPLAASVRRHAPVAVDQSRAVLSKLPDRMVAPSGEKQQLRTLLVCPISVRTSSPVAALQSLSVLSVLPDTIRLLSVLNAHDMTGLVWPASVRRQEPSATRHSLSVLSKLADTIVVPSLLNAQS